jgi:hypothetical protein
MAANFVRILLPTESGEGGLRVSEGRMRGCVSFTPASLIRRAARATFSHDWEKGSLVL